MYTLLHKKIKGKPYSIRHYRGFPKLFLENQALLGFHEAKTGVECGSWVIGEERRALVWPGALDGGGQAPAGVVGVVSGQEPGDLLLHQMAQSIYGGKAL